MGNIFLQRYGKILLAVLIFVFLVAGILVYNLFQTTKIQLEANTIDLLGQQKELSQRLAKSLLLAKNAYIDGEPVEDHINEMVETSKEFDIGLRRLNGDESAKAEDVKHNYDIVDISTLDEIAGSRSAIEETNALWRPLIQQVNEIATRVGSDEAYQDSEDPNQSDVSVKQGLQQASASAEVAIPLLNEISRSLAQQLASNNFGPVIAYQDNNSRAIQDSLDIAEKNYNRGRDISNILEQLKQSQEAYNSIINAYATGEDLKLESGSILEFDNPSSEDHVDLATEAKFAWTPLKRDIDSLLKASSKVEAEELSIPNLFLSTLDYINSNINTISNDMTKVSTQLDADINARANQEKIVQALGLIGALLCFLFILGQVLFSLRKSDAEIDNLQNESKQILDTVDQGLFLLDDKANISSQHSKELLNIFGVEEMANKSLLGFLKNMVSQSDLDQLQRYLKLLFDPHKKERLIQDLNPLQKISAQIYDGNNSQHKFLRFGFSRVIVDEKVTAVLTTVSDITREIELGKQLEQESKRGEQQMDLLRTLMKSDSTLLPVFTKNTATTTDEINAYLKMDSKTTEQYKTKAQEIGILLHKVKGESASLSLDMISDLCHEAENELANIQNRNSLDGGDFLPVAVYLEKLISYNSLIQDLTSRIFSNDDSEAPVATASNNQAPLRNNQSQFSKFANRLAIELGKKVKLRQSGLDSSHIPEDINAGLTTIISQFIRNSLTHGLEDQEMRSRVKKTAIGNISMSLFEGESDFTFEYIDDGKGIDPREIAKKAIELGIIDVERARSMSKNEITNLIFRNSFTASDTVTEHSGRGVGMSAVKSAVTKLGGKIRVVSKPGAFTKFVVRFPKTAAIQKSA